MGFGIYGLGLGSGGWGLGFGVWGLGLGVWGLGFRVLVCGLGFIGFIGFRVSGLGLGCRFLAPPATKGHASRNTLESLSETSLNPKGPKL